MFIVTAHTMSFRSAVLPSPPDPASCPPFTPAAFLVQCSLHYTRHSSPYFYPKARPVAHLSVAGLELCGRARRLRRVGKKFNFIMIFKFSKWKCEYTICLTRPRREAMMIAASRVSRKTMKKMGTENRLWVMASGKQRAGCA